jgi:hypothetical protein
MKTWKATTAAVLELVAGALHLVTGVAAFMLSGALAVGLNIAGLSDLAAIVPVPIVAMISLPLLLLGASALVGGICALQRRHWGFALFGAICSIPPLPSIGGIVAIVLVVLSREEFD